MPWARASQLERVLACPGSLVLPQAPDEPGEAAKWGTDMHTVKETGKPPKHRLNDKPFLSRAAYLNPKHWWPPGCGLHEVSYSWNVDNDTFEVYTGKDAASWKASRDEPCITGTADWVGEDFDGRLHVDDLKTGREPPAPDSAQLLFYALCAVRLLDASEVTLSVTHFPRYPVKSDAVRTEIQLDPSRMTAFVNDVQYARGRYLFFKRDLGKGRLPVLLGRNDVTPTPAGCAWCPAKLDCPA